MAIRIRSLAAAGLLAGTVVLISPSPASAATFTVDITADTVDANIGDGTCEDSNGDCSLRAAIQEANASAGADTITLAAETYELDIVGAGEDAAATGDLDITSDITLTRVAGSSDPDSIISGSALGDRLFHVASGASLDASDLQLIKGTAEDAPSAAGGGSGGAVLNAGTFTASGVLFQSNSAVRAGGVIEGSPGSTTTLSNGSALYNNTAGATPGNGGAVHLTGDATFSMDGGFADANRAANEGGAFWNSSTGTMTLSIVLPISNNTAAGDGSANGGGAIFNQPNATNTGGGTLTVNNISLRDNEATGVAGSGGAIFNGGTATLTNVLLDENSSQRAGGGIEAGPGSTTTITDGEIVNGDAGANPGNGGGIHVTGNGTVDIDGTSVTGNTAANEGGGLWNSAEGTMTVTSAVITANTANGAGSDAGGGGLYNDGGTLDVSNTLIFENSAASTGGGVLDAGGLLDRGRAQSGGTTLTHVTVTDNQAPDGSGVSALGTVTLANSIVAANTGSDDCSGNVASAGGNVVGTCAISGANDVTGVTDPMLDTDFVPVPGSPAIDNGLDANSLSPDLNGVARPLDGDGDGTAASDSGALEAPAADVTTTTSTSTSTTSTSTSTTSTTDPGEVTTTTDGNDQGGNGQTTTTMGNNGGVDNSDQGNGGVDNNGANQGNGAPGANNGALPRTGSNPAPWVALGLTLLVTGAAVLVLRNRSKLAFAKVQD